MNHDNAALDAKQIMAGIPLGVLDHGQVIVIDSIGTDESLLKPLGLSKCSPAELSERLGVLMAAGMVNPFYLNHITLRITMPQFIADRLRAKNQGTFAIATHSMQAYVPEPESIDVVIDEKGTVHDDAQRQVVQEQYCKVTQSLQAISHQAVTYAATHGVKAAPSAINRLQAHYVEWWWSVSLHGLLSVLQDITHQEEDSAVRQYGDVLAAIVKAWVPVTYQAWLDTVYHAVAFTLKEQEVLAPLLQSLVEAIQDNTASEPEKGGAKPDTFTNNEWQLFLSKLQSIGGLCDENSAG